MFLLMLIIIIVVLIYFYKRALAATRIMKKPTMKQQDKKYSKVKILHNKLDPRFGQLDSKLVIDVCLNEPGKSALDIDEFEKSYDVMGSKDSSLKTQTQNTNISNTNTTITTSNTNKTFN